MKTKIYLVRHAETIGNVEKRLTGKSDYELTEHGKESSYQLEKKLKHIKFDKMYASQSQRTVKTIEPLALYNGNKIEKLKELGEMYFGIYDGYKWEDVNKIHSEIRKRQNEINEIVGIPEQETMEQVADRIYHCIEKIAKQNIGKTVLICSHGVAIEAFLRKIVHIPFRYEREKFCQHNSDVNKIEYENGVFYIEMLASKDINNKI